MPTDPHPADVELVAKAMYEIFGTAAPPWTGLQGWYREQYLTHATAVLSALAAAGRLLPADAETRTQWGVMNDDGWTTEYPEGYARRIAADLGQQLMRRQAGPWLPVPDLADPHAPTTTKETTP